jgi:Carboxypeptidase regulatory-like domain/TonB-dependent Receptor Plug Domain
MFTMRPRRALALFALGAVVLAPVALYAQTTTTGAISGTVKDQSGAAVGGAAIVVHNDATNAESALTADGSGFYNAAQLQPGSYTVTISASGFSTLKNTAIVVAVGQSTSLSPALSVASGTQLVTVSGGMPLINFQGPDFTSNLTAQNIENLPINGRRWSDLTLLTPGVVADSNGFGLLSVRGMSPLLNNVTIDGADDNQAYFSEERGRTREGYSTPQVAVQEFQVNTGVYSAEYGRALGGVINSVTKSGSNALHGQLYFYDRDNDWGAKNAFTKLTTFDPATATTTTTQYKPKDWRKQWGFGVGGPLIKDKLFWFYTYDGYRRNFPGTAVASSPATFYKTPDAVIATVNPSTGQPWTCAELIAAAGKGTGLPQDLDSQACVLQARLALPTYGAAVALYNKDLGALSSVLGPVHRTGDQTINMPKLDWQINAKNRVSFIYNRLRWDSPGGVQTQATNTYSNDAFGNDFVKLDYGIARLDTIFTANIVNELRFQYGRELDDESAQPVSPYNAQFINAGSFEGLPASINLPTGGFTNGTQYYSFRQAFPDERKWQIADTVTWTHGQHTFKFGGDIVHNADHIQSLGIGPYAPNGEFNYTYFGNLFADIANPSGTCGTSASEFNIGTLPCYSSFGQNFGPATFNVSTVDYGFFFQDDWKATPRLTVNLGLRYDYQANPGPFQNLLQPVGTFTALPQMSNQPSDKNNLGPRVGFAYDPFGKGKTVVRGGFGMYYGRLVNNILLSAYSATGSPNSQIGISFKNSQGGPRFPQIEPSNFAPTKLAAPSVQYFDKHFQNPQSLEYDLTLQQETGGNTVFSISYLSSLGRELSNFVNTNLVNTQAPNNNTNAGNGYTYVNYVVQPASGTTNCGPLQCGSTFNTKVYNFGYINPAFNAVTDVLSNINSSYNALVVEVVNHTFRYADFDANYTWSHTLDQNQNESTQASTNQLLDPYGDQTYANSSFNVPNRFVAYATLKYPRHFTGYRSSLLDGWNLNPLVQLQNGLPYNLVTSSFPSSASASSGWNGAGGSPAYIPVVGRNTNTLRRTAVFDLRAEKQIQFHDRYTLQLLGEAFNLFNHQNYTSVNTTGYTFGTSTAGVKTSGYTGPQTYTTQLNYNPSFGTYTNSNSNYAYSPRQVQLALRLSF